MPTGTVAGIGDRKIVRGEFEAEATAAGSLVVNGVQFAGALTSAGIVQESTGSVDIQKK